MSRRHGGHRRHQQDALGLLAIGGVVAWMARTRWLPLVETGGRTDLLTPAVLTVAGLVIGGGLLLALRRARTRRRRHAQALALLQDAEQLRHLDGVVFEHALHSLWERQGYRVETTRATGDFGADLLLQRHGQTTVVQAKRYQARVGVHAVQEVLAAREYYRAHAAMVITTADYTAAARELAVRTGVILWDGPRLAAAVQAVRSHPQQEKGDPA